MPGSRTYENNAERDAERIIIVLNDIQVSLITCRLTVGKKNYVTFCYFLYRNQRLRRFDKSVFEYGTALSLLNRIDGVSYRFFLRNGSHRKNGREAAVQSHKTHIVTLCQFVQYRISAVSGCRQSRAAHRARTVDDNHYARGRRVIDCLNGQYLLIFRSLQIRSVVCVGIAFAVFTTDGKQTAAVLVDVTVYLINGVIFISSLRNRIQVGIVSFDRSGVVTQIDYLIHQSQIGVGNVVENYLVVLTEIVNRLGQSAVIRRTHVNNVNLVLYRVGFGSRRKKSFQCFRLTRHAFQYENLIERRYVIVRTIKVVFVVVSDVGNTNLQLVKVVGRFEFMFKFNFLNLAAEKVYGNDAVVAVAVAYFAVVIQLDGNVSHVDVTLNENLYRTRFVCLYVIIWQLHADYFGVVFFVLRSHVYDVNEHISVLVGHYTANNA